MVKKPNYAKLPVTQKEPEFLIKTQRLDTSRSQAAIRIKKRPTTTSARERTTKTVSSYKETPLEEQVRKEMEAEYREILDKQMESVKEFGMMGERGMGVEAGVVMKENDGRRLKGPPYPKLNRMSIEDY